MLSSKMLKFLIVILFASVPASQVMATDKFTNADFEQEYISTKDVITMNQGYPLHVEGIGEVLIKSVQNSYASQSDRSGKSLLVNTDGLSKKILRHFKSLNDGMHDGRSASDLVSLSQNPGDIVICVPVNGGAPICFTINCDYDPDSAVLPCT